jgi:hypothetical protein
LTPDWVPSFKSSQAAVRDYLDSIHLTPVDQADPDQWVLPSGVRLVFRDGRLDSIQHSLREKPREKQVSLTIPEPVWEKLRDEAARRKLSPAQLGSELISQGVNLPKSAH